MVSRADTQRVNEMRDRAAADPEIREQASAHYSQNTVGLRAGVYLKKSLDGMNLDNLKLDDDKKAMAELGIKFKPLPGVAPQSEISSPGQDSGKGGRP